ncbi:hypothetical protein BLNAU_23941 [Blattamonas nauphoetae]|uniref:Uncharacterized protein n=1 Tax=Blattamonas nauphoetae TaxID=2049346 RepID=A0ABQ9WNT2_9EUKA|nr:hypothetical protein BLNAU_23941 [Blattamonas nauphoetae]
MLKIHERSVRTRKQRKVNLNQPFTHILSRTPLTHVDLDVVSQEKRLSGDHMFNSPNEPLTNGFLTAIQNLNQPTITFTNSSIISNNPSKGINETEPVSFTFPPSQLYSEFQVGLSANSKELQRDLQSYIHQFKMQEELDAANQYEASVQKSQNKQTKTTLRNSKTPGRRRISTNEMSLSARTSLQSEREVRFFSEFDPSNPSLNPTDFKTWQQFSHAFEAYRTRKSQKVDDDEFEDMSATIFKQHRIHAPSALFSGSDPTFTLMSGVTDLSEVKIDPHRS